MRETKDPAILWGDRHRKFRVQFWDYFTVALLEAFAQLCGQGLFGRIASFKGAGRTRTGARCGFEWIKGGRLRIRPSKAMHGAGGIVLKGQLDFQTINRIRNFPIFHLRGFYKKPIPRKWRYRD